jgi:anti-sigma B factor antagonist
MAEREWHGSVGTLSVASGLPADCVSRGFMSSKLTHPSTWREPRSLVAGQGASGRLLQPNRLTKARPFSPIPARPQLLVPPRWLEIELVADITLVRFARRRILSEETIDIIAGQLSGLVQSDRHRKLVLNFTNIDRLATAMLGKLVLLQSKLKATGGRLVLCHVAPHLYEIFSLLKLRQILSIYRGEPEALEALGRRGSRRWN